MINRQAALGKIRGIQGVGAPCNLSWLTEIRVSKAERFSLGSWEEVTIFPTRNDCMENSTLDITLKRCPRRGEQRPDGGVDTDE